MTNSKEMKVVYAITNSKGRSYWHRIGSGFVNRDGSLNIVLFALPVDGKLHVRDYVSRDAMYTSGGSADDRSDDSSVDDVPPEFG